MDPGNTDLIAQKHRLLGEQIDNTKNKLKILQEADEQAKTQLANGEIGIEDYEALQREIIRTENDLKKYEGQLDKLTDANEDLNKSNKTAGEKLTAFGDKASKIGDNLQNAGKKMTTGLTVPLAGAVALAGAAWAEIDEAFDGIATATGATGDALDGLHDSFKEVFTTMPVEADVVASAIGELNTQFGFTGEELEEATTYAAKFAAINNAEVSPSVKNAKGAIEALGLESSDFSRVLDAVTTASQDTGKSTDELFDLLQKGAPQINDLNLSVEDAAMLLGKMDQAGLDSSRTFGGLTRAQISAADEGKTLNEALSEFTEFANSSATETDKLAAAAELFGTRNGPAMYQAAQQGVFDFDALGDSADRAAGVVETTFEATLDPIDHAKTALNNMKIAGAELFEEIQIAGTPVLEGMVDVTKKLTEWFTNLSPEAKEAGIKIGAVLIAAGPATIVLGHMVTSVGALSTAFGKAATSITANGGFAGALAKLVSSPAAPLVAVAVMAIEAGRNIGDMIELFKTGSSDTREFVERIRESRDAFSDQSEEVKEAKDKAKALIEELGFLNDKQSLTTDETKRLAQVVRDLNILYPELNIAIDKNTGHMVDSTEAAEARIEMIENEKSIIDINQQIADSGQRLAEIDELRTAATDELNERLGNNKNRIQAVGDAIKDAILKKENLGLIIGDLQGDVKILNEEFETEQAVLEGLKGKLDEAEEKQLTYAETLDTLTETEKVRLDELETAAEEAADRAAETEARRRESAEAYLAAEKERQLEHEALVAEYYETLETKTEEHYGEMGSIEDEGIAQSEITAAKIKENLDKQIEDYRLWGVRIKELSAKVPPDVAEELEALGPEYSTVVDELNQMTEDELADWVSTWQEKSALAASTAKEELQGTPAELAKIAEDTQISFDKELAKIPKHVRDNLSDAQIDAIRYGVALYGEMSGIGRNASDGFAAGLRASKSRVSAAAQEVAALVPKTTRAFLQIASPSKLMRKDGQNTGEGLELGILDTIPDIRRAALEAAKATEEAMTSADLDQISLDTTGTVRGGTLNNQTTNENITINVTASAGQSDEDTRQIGVLVYQGWNRARAAKGG